MRTLSSVFSCIALVCASGLALAQSAPQREIRFDVPSQPLSGALNKFAEQSSLRIVYYTDLTEGVTAPALTGSHTPEGALKLLLSTSRLTYEFVNERTVRISAPAARVPESGKPRESAAAGGSAALRLAQIEPQRQQSQASDEQTTAQEDKGVPEILVKGSKLLNMDIRRDANDARPYVVFDRETLEHSGAVDLQDFLKNRLSMGTSSLSESQSPASTSGNTSSVNLRGLGADETLILVDGRRLPAYSVRGSTAQPDLNGIPLAAIERIEVLPATASGIYGGSATGGAINIVMRRDYSGVETGLSYNNTFDTDVAMRRVELSSGFSLGSRTSVLLSGSWSDAEALLTQDRDFAVRMRQLIMRNDPGSILDVATPPVGATTNIRSSTGGPLSLKSGGAPFSAAQTFVPYGYAGPASDSGALLRANAGKYNLDLADNAASGAGHGKRLALRNSPTVKNAMGSLRHEFTESLSGFLEASASENIGVFTRSPLFGGIPIPNTSPGNPFNQSIRVTLPSLGTVAQDDANLTTYRVAGGVIAALPGGWSSGLDYTWGRTRLTNALLRRAYSAGLIAAVADGSINIFRDLNAYPIDFNQFLTGRIRRSPTVTTLQDLSLRFSGPLPFVTLPGGAPTLSTLLEQRREKFGDQIEFFPASPTLFFNTLWPDRAQRVNSVHAEVLLPLVSEQNSMPGVRKLELQIAARHDRYTTNAAAAVDVDDDGVPLGDITYFSNEISSTDPTVALRYQPAESLMLRMSYGTGFLPPSADQWLQDFGTQEDVDFGGELTDPRRGGQGIGSVFIRGDGAGVSLRPEKSTGWSAGAVLTPRLIEGLRVSVDWVSIHKTDNIASIFSYSQQDLENEQNVPGLVIRGPRPAGDPYEVGPVIGFNGGLFNVAELQMDAVDFAVDYVLETAKAGSFDFVLGATRLLSLQTQLSPTSGELEYAGVGPNAIAGSAIDSGGLSWKGSATLTWRREHWTLGWTTRYAHKYFINIDHSVDPQQGSASVPSQNYHDLFGTYRFAGSNLARFLPGESELQFGVNNVLNKKPPLDVIGVGFNAPGYSYYGDPRLANYYLRFKSRFGR